MSERRFNEVFSQRLQYYMGLHKITQVDLAKRLGVGTTSVHNWCSGIKTPRMDKVDKMCQIFGCLRSDLINEVSSESFTLTPRERTLVAHYRKADIGTKASVDKLLDMPGESIPDMSAG